MIMINKRLTSDIQIRISQYLVMPALIACIVSNYGHISLAPRHQETLQVVCLVFRESGSRQQASCTNTHSEIEKEKEKAREKPRSTLSRTDTLVVSWSLQSGADKDRTMYREFRCVLGVSVYRVTCFPF